MTTEQIHLAAGMLYNGLYATHAQSSLLNSLAMDLGLALPASLRTLYRSGQNALSKANSLSGMGRLVPEGADRINSAVYREGY